MNTVRQAVVGVCAIAVLGPIATGQELLTNGGAELGTFAGWSLDSSQFPAGDEVFAVVSETVNLVDAFSGDLFFSHTAATTGAVSGSGVESIMRQTVPALGGGTPLVLAGAVVSDGPPSCDPGMLRLVFRDSGGGELPGGADSGWVLSNDAWRFVQVEAVTPSGAATMTVELRARLDCGVFINTYFDRVSLSPAGGCNAADIAPAFGVLDLSDINAFVAGFLSGDPIADLDDDGLFDLSDIGLFVTAFTGGCS
jgi:hypothetical protein